MAESFADLFGLNNNTKNSFDTLRFDSFKPTEFKPIMGGDPHMQGMFAGLYNASNALTGYANNKISEASRDTAQYSTNMFLNELQKASASASQEDIPYIISMFSDILENDQSIMQDKGREALNALQARTAQGEAEQLKIMLELAKKGMTGGSGSGSGFGSSTDKSTPINHGWGNVLNDRIKDTSDSINKFSANNYGKVKSAVVSLTNQGIIEGRIGRAEDIESYIRDYAGRLGIEIGEDTFNKLVADVKKEISIDYNNPNYQQDLHVEENRIKTEASSQLYSKLDAKNTFVGDSKDMQDFLYGFTDSYVQVATGKASTALTDILKHVGDAQTDGELWYNPTYVAAALQYIINLDPGQNLPKEVADVKNNIIGYMKTYLNPGKNQPDDNKTAFQKIDTWLQDLTFFKGHQQKRQTLASMLAYGSLSKDNKTSNAVRELMDDTVVKLQNARNKTETLWLQKAAISRSSGMGTDAKDIAKAYGARAENLISSLRQDYGALREQLKHYNTEFDNLITSASAPPVQPTQEDQQVALNTLRSMNLSKGRDADGKTVTSYYFSDVAHFNTIYNNSPVMKQALGPIIAGMRDNAYIDFNLLVNKEAFSLGPYWDGNGYAIGFGNHINDQFPSAKDAKEYIDDLKKRVNNGEAYSLVNDSQYMSLIAKSMQNEYAKFAKVCLGPNSPVARLVKNPEFMKLKPEVQQNYISKLNTMLFLASYRGDLGNKAVKDKMKAVTDLKSAQALADTLAWIKISKKQKGKNKRYGDFQFLG